MKMLTLRGEEDSVLRNADCGMRGEGSLGAWSGVIHNKVAVFECGLPRKKEAYRLFGDRSDNGRVADIHC